MSGRPNPAYHAKVINPTDAADRALLESAYDAVFKPAWPHFETVETPAGFLDYINPKPGKTFDGTVVVAQDSAGHIVGFNYAISAKATPGLAATDRVIQHVYTAVSPDMAHSTDRAAIEEVMLKEVRNQYKDNRIVAEFAEVTDQKKMPLTGKPLEGDGAAREANFKAANPLAQHEALPFIKHQAFVWDHGGTQPGSFDPTTGASSNYQVIAMTQPGISLSKAAVDGYAHLQFEYSRSTEPEVSGASAFARDHALDQIAKGWAEREAAQQRRVP